MIPKPEIFFTPFILSSLRIDMNNNIIKKYNNNNNNVRQCLSVCLSDKKNGEMTN